MSKSDEDVEANLSTVFQSVSRSEVLCMLREYGSPTLFLTLSCAEYESLENANYLKKVNKVPDSYPIGKLCTEDPISVSKKFSQKFHDFFQTVILKGEVLVANWRRRWRGLRGGRGRGRGKEVCGS